MKRILPSLALGSLLVACTVAPPATTPVAPPLTPAGQTEAPVAPAAIAPQPSAAPSVALTSPTPTVAPSPSPARRSKRRSTPQDTVSFQDDDLGTAVLNYNFTAQGVVDGARRGQATMAVRLEDGTRTNVAFDDYDLPVEGDDDDYVVVSEGANVRTYKADQEFMSYTISAPAAVPYRISQESNLSPILGEWPEEGEGESDYVDPAWDAATSLTLSAYPDGPSGIAYDITSSASSITTTGYGPVIAAEICLKYRVMREASLPGLIALYSVVKERPETSTGMGPAAAFALLNHQPVAGARMGKYAAYYYRVLSGDGETLNPAAAVLKEIIRLRQSPPDTGEDEGEEGGLEE